MPIIPKPSGPTHELPGARFTSLATPSRGSATTSIWLVELSRGRPVTPHELTAEEVFVVLNGRASVRLGGEQCEVGPGDCIVVPPYTPFSAEAVGSVPFVAVCCLPAGGRARLANGEEFVPPWA
jgi:mannose-6-phosphate isomerase-like protein (cupin superfamily)